MLFATFCGDVLLSLAIGGQKKYRIENNSLPDTCVMLSIDPTFPFLLIFACSFSGITLPELDVP